jgi:hypothetical protein
MNPTTAKRSHKNTINLHTQSITRSEHISSEIFLKRTERKCKGRGLDVCISILIAADAIGTQCREPEASSISEGPHKNNKQQPEAVVAVPSTCTDHYALLHAYSRVLSQ